MSDFFVTDSLQGELAGISTPLSSRTQSFAFVNDRVSAELIFIRLALGTVSIEARSSGLHWSQRTDFCVLGAPASTCRSRADLLAYMAGRGIDQSGLDKHLQGNLRQSAFYQELLGELLHALVRENNGQHTLAFVHIYRMLERISFAFPVLYAVKATDFKSAYTKLKEFYGGADKGELAFFSKFVETAVDDVLTAGNSTVDFRYLKAEHRDVAYTKVKQFIGNGFIAGVEGESIEINNKNILGLMIVLRNRFFHFMSNHDQNLSVIDVPDPDAFFKCFNLLFLNWLLVIYFEILIWQAK